MMDKFLEWSSNITEATRVNDMIILLERHERYADFATAFISRKSASKFTSVLELQKYIVSLEPELPKRIQPIASVQSQSARSYTPREPVRDSNGNVVPRDFCWNIALEGSCRYGDKCRYKHDKQDKRERRNYRRHCLQVFCKGGCNDFENCQYIHVKRADLRRRDPAPNCPGCLNDYKSEQEKKNIIECYRKELIGVIAAKEIMTPRLLMFSA